MPKSSLRLVSSERPVPAERYRASNEARKEAPEQREDNAVATEADMAAFAESQRKSWTQERAESYVTGGKVERMNANGEREAWTVDTIVDDRMYLSHEGRRVITTRAESALEERALDYSPEIAQHWVALVATTVALVDTASQEKIKKIFAQDKTDIIELAALSCATDDLPDFRKSLQEALTRIVRQAVAHATANEVWKRAVHANGVALRERFNLPEEAKAFAHDIAAEEDEENAGDFIGVDEDTISGIASEKTGAVHIDRTPSRSDASPDVVRAELARHMVEAQELRIVAAPEIVEVEEGELSIFEALETMHEEHAQQMTNEDIDAQLRLLDDFRAKLGDPTDKWLIYAALADLQARELVLRAERDTRSAEKLGVVQEMLADITAGGAMSLRFDVAKLNKERDACEPGSREWKTKDADAWEAEKRLLTATGKTDMLQPEKFSLVYAYLNSQREIAGEKEIARLLLEAENSSALNAREAEGIRRMWESLPYTREEFTEKRVAPVDRKAKTKKSSAPTRALPAGKDGFTEEDGWFGEGDREPMTAAMYTDRRYQKEDQASRTLEEPLATVTEPFRIFSRLYGGTTEFVRQYNELKEDTNKIHFTLENLRNAGPIKRWWYGRQMAAASRESLKKLSKKNRKGKLQA